MGPEPTEAVGPVTTVIQIAVAAVTRTGPFVRVGMARVSRPGCDQPLAPAVPRRTDQ